MNFFHIKVFLLNINHYRKFVVFHLLKIILFFSGCEKSNVITSTWRKKGKFWSAGRSTFKVSEGAKLRWTIELTFDKEIIALLDNNAHTNCNGKTCTVENKYYKPDEGNKVTLKYRIVYQSKPKPQVTRQSHYREVPRWEIFWSN